MQQYTLIDFINAWKNGDIDLCKNIGISLLQAILKDGPQSFGWQHYIKSLIEKLSKLTISNYTKKTALLDEIRLVIQTY